MKLSDLTTIQKNDLFNTLRISLTHHSSAIEGISLTFGETKRLLEYGMTAQSKPLHEQLVVIGFASAFDFVIREASNSSSSLNSGLVKDIHAILFDKALAVSPERVERPVGSWRKDDRYIKGVDIKLSEPRAIDQHLNNLVYRYDKSLNLNEIAKFHIDFEIIHPFADGNGRVGRLLMTYQAIKNDYIPPLILNDNRLDYLDSLADANRLEKFLELSIQNSVDLVR
ncbi:Fic family protein [Francisella sp. XLW-1]|uniref:Fic family protein n=1 Tax=Francisella sp. XLW-1 TaxID=2610887 RepID=UPI00123DEDA5|nr:Fic family protein [Francisella sp. XLW-1]